MAVKKSGFFKSEVIRLNYYCYGRQSERAIYIERSLDIIIIQGSFIHNFNDLL